MSPTSQVDPNPESPSQISPKAYLSVDCRFLSANISKSTLCQFDHQRRHFKATTFHLYLHKLITKTTLNPTSTHSSTRVQKCKCRERQRRQKESYTLAAYDGTEHTSLFQKGNEDTAREDQTKALLKPRGPTPSSAALCLASQVCDGVTQDPHGVGNLTHPSLLPAALLACPLG